MPHLRPGSGQVSVQLCLLQLWRLLLPDGLLRWVGSPAPVGVGQHLWALIWGAHVDPPVCASSISGPGLPLYTLRDNRASGAGQCQLCSKARPCLRPELHECLDWLRLGPVSMEPFGTFSAPPTNIHYYKLNIFRVITVVLLGFCFSRACSSWRQQGAKRYPVRVPNANSAVRHAKDCRIWWDPPCWHIKMIGLFPIFERYCNFNVIWFFFPRSLVSNDVASKFQEV